MNRTKISSTLNKKRKITFLKKFLLIFFYTLFLISLLILSLTNDKLRIKEIKVSGNNSISSDELINFVDKRLDERYLGFIPTDNFILFKRFNLERELMFNFKKIKSIDFNFSNLNLITLNITERNSDSLWCDNLSDINIDCYFMDNTGFIFAKAPKLGNNLFFKYSGFVDKNNPIGNYFLNNTKFLEINSFVSEIKKIGFNPESLYALPNDEYEIILSGGTKILFDNNDTISKNILKMKVLVENKYLETNKDFISSIEHIDLRYGNKVHYDFKK